jgi:hypothetical protein
MRELHDQALVEDRSGAWRIRLVIGLCCPFCDRIVHAAMWTMPMQGSASFVSTVVVI